ncbi:MAG: DUF5906 domain-containing protein [Synechococcus sp.]
MTLSPEHRRKLRKSALTDQQIDSFGWCSLHNGRLLIPYLAPDGSPQTCHDGKPFSRERLSVAEIAANPKGGKYCSPAGEGCRIYHSKLAILAGRYEQRAVDRYTPARITEGETKTESATVHDRERVTFGTGGINSWQDRYDGQSKDEPSLPLTDWDELIREGREIRLCPDSDFRKPQVAAGLRGLAEMALSKGAHVLIEVLPHHHERNDDEGRPVRLGVDDLIAEYGPELFRQIASIARSPFKMTAKGPVWEFKPEPQDTNERSVYLVGTIGRDWRADPIAPDRWYHWNGRHWEAVIGNDLVMAEIHAYFDRQGWVNREYSTMRSLLACFRAKVGVLPPTATRGLIPLRNGCLRISDHVLVPHDRDHGNRSSLPFDWDPQASAEPIVQFLRDTLASEADVQIVRAFARAIVHGQRLKAFLEITGAGDTGKSQVGNLLIALAGEENSASMDLAKLESESSRFESRKLAGKRLALFNESHRYHGSLETLKALTGGDRIRAEIKGSNADCDFVFRGVAVLIGNGMVQPSDTYSAVLNRRRAVFADRVVRPADQRPMLERGEVGWVGELVPHLAGLLVWALTMEAAAAREVLARNHRSLDRIEANYRALLETDPLAHWADEFLVWDPTATGQRAARVGGANNDANDFLFPSYRKVLADQDLRPLGSKSFKTKLVSLLRDALGLALPEGPPSSGAYRDKWLGSLVPCLRFRTEADNAAGIPGLIRFALLAQSFPEPDPSGDGKEMAERRQGDGKNPDQRREVEGEMGNGEKPPSGKIEPRLDPPMGAQNSPVGGEPEFAVSAISPVSCKGSCLSGAVSAASDPRISVSRQGSSPTPAPNYGPLALGTPVEVTSGHDIWMNGWVVDGLPDKDGPGALVPLISSDGKKRKQTVRRRNIRTCQEAA